MSNNLRFFELICEFLKLNFFCIGCALIGYFLLMTFPDDERFKACSLYSMPLPQSLNGGYIMTAMIAMIR